MTYQREQGFLGRAMSLSGIIADRGRQAAGKFQQSWGVSDNVTLLQANERRVWACITNDGSIDFTLLFSNEGATTANSPCITLSPGGSLTIDYWHPWTGRIGVYQAGPANAAISYVEVSLA